MDSETNENSEVYNHYLELSKPTKEDFERVFTDEELKELCLKHKCSVDMYRWNVVNDYRLLFTESGRFQRWSERNRLHMLAKAVNKMKPAVLYDDKAIMETRKQEWGLQLKENILSLNYWRRKRAKNDLLQASESSSCDIDRELQSECDINTESANAGELLTQSENLSVNAVVDDEIQLQIQVDTESMGAMERQTQSQNQERESISEIPPQTAVNYSILQSKQATGMEVTHAKSSQSEDENVLIAYFDEEYLTDESSNDSTETVLINRNQIELAEEGLHSQEVAPEIENIYGIDTLSMTIDSQVSTEYLQFLQSQDIVAQSYDNFKNIIPLTSTQSQSQESKEVF